jgi:bacterioferritin
MQGSEKLIATLNALLADELTAISQYMVHSEMCDHWGYERLHKSIEAQAKEEMQHAEWLIQRILYLEGTPTMTKLNPLRIGKTVLEMVTADEQAEVDAIRAYNRGIMLAGEEGDQSTADLLTQILKMEEAHAEWNRIQRVQIDHMGLQNFLANQAHAAA